MPIKFSQRITGGISTKTQIVEADIDFVASDSEIIAISIDNTIKEILCGRLYIDEDPGAFAAWATITFYNKNTKYGKEAFTL